MQRYLGEVWIVLVILRKNYEFKYMSFVPLCMFVTLTYLLHGAESFLRS